MNRRHAYIGGLATSNMDDYDLTPFDIVLAACDRATERENARIERETEKKMSYPKWWRRLHLPPLFSWPAMFIWGRNDFNNCYLTINQ